MPEGTRVFWTISLDDPLATAPDRAGAKAADLARAARHDLPVLPGFVIPVPCIASQERYVNTGELRGAWARLSHGGARPLVVRPSPTREDGSLLGRPLPTRRFAPVLDVRGWPEFVTAVEDVASSAGSPGTMAVLVQPRLDAASSGVVFGADLPGGRKGRVIVSAAPGGPGTRTGGTRYTLSRRGKVLESRSVDGAEGPLTALQLRALARLAARAASVFAAPRDIEFAFGHDGGLWILRTAPVTASAPLPPRRAALPA